MFCCQRKPQRRGACREIRPFPSPECRDGEEHGGSAQERNRKVRHHHGQVRGYSRVDREKCDRSESHAGTESSPSGKPQAHEQQSVQGEHGDPCTLLHKVRVVVEVDIFYSDGSIVLLTVKRPPGSRSIAGDGTDAWHPWPVHRTKLATNAKSPK